MSWNHNPKPSGGAGAGPAKGSGLGGPAKGRGKSVERPAFELGNAASAAENRTGGTAYRRMAKEERVGKLTEMAFDLAEKAEGESVKSGMIQYLMNREMGSPTAKQEVTGKDGSPLEIATIRRVIVDPRDPDT